MKKEFEVLDLIIYVLWALIIGFILLNLCFDFQNFILVGLAALLASASVMKNIANTNKIEEQKVKRELFDRRKKIIFEMDELYFLFANHLNFNKEINDTSNLEAIDSFDRTSFIEYMKEKSSLDFNKENHLKYIQGIIDLLSDAEFIFEEKDLNLLSPIMNTLLIYYSETSKSEEILAGKSLSSKELYNQLIKFCNQRHESIRLV